MKDYVEEFLIAIGLDMSDVDKGINKTVNTVKGGLSNLLTGIVAPALAGLASGALVQQFTDEITQVDRLSTALGMNVEQLSAWRTAAEMAGVQADEVSELFADFNDWMLDAAQNQSGAMYEYIEKGFLPAVEDANGKLKDTEQYILEVSDALNKMGEQQGSGLARQIGISNFQSAAFLQQGSGAIKAQLEAARQMGVYTKQDAEAAKELDKAIKTTQRSLQMILLPAFRIIAPVLTGFAEGVSRLVRNMGTVKPVLVAVAAVLTGLLLPSIIATTKAALAFFATPPGMLIAALTLILLLLDDFLVWLNGGESQFGEFYEMLFGSTEEAKALFESLGETIESLGGYANTFLIIAGAVGILSAAIGICGGLISFLGIVASAVLSPMGAVILSIGAAIYLVNKYWDDLVAAFQSGMDWITEKINWLQGKLGSLKSMLPSLDFKFGVEQAVPAAASNSNVTTNNNTDVQGTVNITVQGNMDKDTMQTAQQQSADWFSVKQADGAYA